MALHLPGFIAWRYLRSGKRGGSFGAIAAVSIAGVAIATAALICVLSVFNGFQEILISRNSRLLPDVEVKPRHGKVIEDGDSLAAAIGRLAGVAEACPIIADQALAINDGLEMPLMLKGLDLDILRRFSDIDSLLLNLPATPPARSMPDSIWGYASVGVASGLDMWQPGRDIFIFAPRRIGRINPANPAASFLTDSVPICGIFESRDADMDAATLFVPLSIARRLFQYDTQATSIAVFGRSRQTSCPELEKEKKDTNPTSQKQISRDVNQLYTRVKKLVGNDYEVLSLEMQQEASYKMVMVEKWITALLLVLILIIASFNIISAMSMAVVEKQRSLHIWRALGMDSRKIGRIFGWESFFITCIGAIAGVVLGISLTLCQQHFGWIRIAGFGSDDVLSAYPVAFRWIDVPAVLIPVLAIGLLTSLIAASFAQRRISEKRR